MDSSAEADVRATPRQLVGTSPDRSAQPGGTGDRVAPAATSVASSSAASAASGSAPPSPTEHAPASNDRAVILHPSRRYPALWQAPSAQRGSSTSSSRAAAATDDATGRDDRALILHPSRRYPELWPEPTAQRGPSTSSPSAAAATEHAPASNDRAVILHPSRRYPELWQDPAAQRGSGGRSGGRSTGDGASSPASSEHAPAGDHPAVILPPSRLHPELGHAPASPTAPSHARTDEVGDEIDAEIDDEIGDEIGGEIAPPDDAVGDEIGGAIAPPDDAVDDTAVARDSHETTRPPSAANIALPASRTESIASADSEPERSPEQARARQRADYYKAWSYLGQGIGAAMAIAGWGVLLGLPMEARVALLIAQLGVNVGSASKNALGSADDRHKGHQVTGDSDADVDKRVGSRRKARGQAISAGGGALSIVGNAVPTAFPAPVPPLRAINGVAALLNAYGQLETGRGELRLGNPAKATSNFVASATNVTGAGGQFGEVGGGSQAAFPHAQGIGTLNSAMTPPGGAIDDARGSKKRWPYATDPKVVGQVLAFVGQGLSATALWMFNAYRVSSSPKNNQGQAQPDTDYLQTIAIVGLLGASILALGSGVSAYAEWPKTRAPGQDMEMAVTNADDHDTAPTGAPPPDPSARG